MPRGSALLLFAWALLSPAVAGAGPAAVEPPTRREPPPAADGFQLSLGTGASFPLGNATGAPGDSLSRRYAWQAPLRLDLGAKLTDAIYAGVYLGFATGAEGSDVNVEAYCEDDDSNLSDDVSCSAHTVRLGVEGRYSFTPGERWSPWLGYGAGIETATEQLDDQRARYRETTTVYGYTLAKISAGMDYRAGSVVGVGPFGEFAAGTFTQTVTEVNDEVRFDGEIEDPAWHFWLTLGVRMVLFP